MPPPPGGLAAVGGLTGATLTFTPIPSGAYYEVQVLDAAGAAIPALPAVFSCHSHQAPPTCVEAADAGGGKRSLALPASAFGSTTGRFRLRLRGYFLDYDVPGTWAGPVAVTVGPVGNIGRVEAQGSGSGAVVRFPPASLAEGYLIEVLDAAGQVVATAQVDASQLAACPNQP